MSETLVTFDEPIRDSAGTLYRAKACGRQRDDGLWEGWIEFENASTGELLATPRETTQPNRQDTAYWATGLTPVFLEGALARTFGRPVREAAPPPPPAFDGPAETGRRVPPAATREAILDPFSVYQKSPDVLAQELRALRSWHLRRIIRDYQLADVADSRLDRMTEPDLSALIMRRVARLCEMPR